jgi:hypothetical protein
MAHSSVLVTALLLPDTARRPRLLEGYPPLYPPTLGRGRGGDGHQREPSAAHGCGPSGSAEQARALTRGLTLIAKIRGSSAPNPASASAGSAKNRASMHALIGVAVQFFLPLREEVAQVADRVHVDGDLLVGEAAQ